MRKVKSLLMVLIAFASLFVVGLSVLSNNKVSAAELTTAEKVQADLDALTVVNRPILSFPVATISAYGNTIEWTSSDNTVLDTTKMESTEGWIIVNRPVDEDKAVTLTATVTASDSTSDSKVFNVTVPKGLTYTFDRQLTYIVAEGATNSNPTTCKVGSYVELADVELENYIFEGWFTDSGYTTQVTCVPMGSGNVILYAKLTAKALSSIEIQGSPKTTYTAFESFDLDEATVIAKYNDGSQITLNDTQYSVSKTELVVSDESVVISYTENEITKEATVNVTVNPLSVAVVWTHSDSYEYTGLDQSSSVIAKYTDKNNEEQSLSYSFGESVVFKNASSAYVATVTTSAAGENYTLTNNTLNLTIGKKALSITADNKNMNFGASVPEFTVTCEGFVGSETIESLSGTLSFDCDATSSSSAGEYAITPKGLTSENYDISFNSGNLTISASKLNIYADKEDTTVTYNGTNQTFAAKVDDEFGNDITSECILTYTLNSQAFTGVKDVESYFVTVNAVHPTLGSKEVIFVFEIVPKVLELEWTAPVDLVYSKTAKVPTVIAKASSIIGEDTYTITSALTEGNNNVNVGSFTYTATRVSNNNYTLPENAVSPSYTITAKEVTLAWTAPTNLIYSKTEKVPTIIVNGLEDGDACTATIALTEGNNNVNVGSFTYTATALDNYNYKLPDNATSDAYTILAKEVTLEWTSPADLVFSDSEKVPTVTVNDLEDGDACIATIALTEGNNNVNVGSFTYTVTALDNSNYKLPVDITSETYTITKKSLGDGTTLAEGLTVSSIEDQVRTGNAITPTFTLTYKNALVLDTDYTVAYENNLGSSIENTEATITVTAKSGSNYDGSFQVTFNIVMNVQDKFNLDVTNFNTKYASLNNATLGVLPTLDTVLTNGSTVQWISNNTNVVISSQGEVTLLVNEATTATLTANIRFNDDAATVNTYVVNISIESATVTDADTNVSVTGQVEGLVVEATAVESEQLSNYQVIENENALAAYDITLTSVNTTVQPNGNVTVKVPVPEGATASQLEVFYYNSTDGTYTNMNATVEGEYLVFTTNHFSKYVIAVEKFTVTFNSDGGSEVDELLVAKGTAATEPADPTKDGKSFVKWQLNSNDYDFTAAVNEDITLVAVWEDEGIPVKTIAEAKELPDSDTLYQVTGIVSDITNTLYGKFYLVDPNNSETKILVYILTNAELVEETFASLDVKEGDTLTLVGHKTTYKSAPELIDCYFVSRVKATFNVVVNVADNETGSATSSVTSAERGSEVTITLAPATGYKLDTFKVNNTLTTVTGNTYTFTLVANTTIDVTFVEESAAETTSTYTLVTDVSTLNAGDKIIIVAKDESFALSTTQTDNNRAQAVVTKDGDNASFLEAAGVQVITLEAGTKANTFSFNTGSGYLYAASSSKNYLKTETNISNNSSWTIAIADGVATIIAQGGNTRNLLRYNTGNDIFSCYSSGQQDICIYKLTTNN